MVKKFNWEKINKTKLINNRGTYNLEKEANHILNSDKYWKRKLKGKHKKFFKMWEKELNKIPNN
jgi:hypothetical protein